MRASEGTGGVQGTDSTVANTLIPHGSYGAKFSPDGNMLLFWSSAENLVAGDNDNRWRLRTCSSKCSPGRTPEQPT